MILKIVVFVVLKWLWVTISTMGHGTFEGEKTEILRRRNYLTNKLLVSPEEIRYVFWASSGNRQTMCL